MSDISKALEKIKKCLAMAASSNANEAATALRQAQVLMQKYDISETDIEAADAKSFQSKSNVQSKPSSWEALLAQTVSMAFNCDYIFTRNIFGEANWKFIGVGVSAELSGYAFNVLLRQIKKDRTNYIKSSLSRCKQKTKTIRADNYCNGWISEVYFSVKNFAPAVEKPKAVKAYIKKNHSALTTIEPRKRKAAGSSKQNEHNDHYAGSKDAENVSLNHGVSSEKNRIGHHA